MTDQQRDPAPAEAPRTVLLVAGAGRSGTSTMSGVLSRLGMHVPQPEVVADETNPKGFGEPQWVVDLHNRLLDEAGVAVSDARPSAWGDTGALTDRDRLRGRTARWLEQHFAEGPELVVKDPRLSWFLPLWQVASARAGARAVTVTMLRPPAEVVGSRQKYYGSRLGDAHLVASWVNVLLHTEHATRGGDGADGGEGARAFVRYTDLLDDWARVVDHLGSHLDLRSVQAATPEQVRDVHAFVDPDLRRVQVSLADLALPPRLHELVDAAWQQLDALADPGADTPTARAGLDEVRGAYTAYYEECEAVSRSSAVAAATRARRNAAKEKAAAPAAAAQAQAPAAAPTPSPLARLRGAVSRGARGG